ncbi:hypothetical protein ACSYAD_08770 [Acaryochloris marina NIES-2412]|uniref:hypothetical protein n=1 Tax=Acaryochloris marina TaxID=155978 RepID=UPI0040585826
MDDKAKQHLAMHVAEPTVVPARPYANLEIPVFMSNPDQDFFDKWINPFYQTNINELL